MTIQEQYYILRQGAKKWNTWRSQNREVLIDLIRADLRGADLSGADFNDADLSRAKLIGAKLIGAKLSNAYLRETDLRETDLSEADLKGAKLSNANLRGANLSEADFRGDDLSETDLSNADLSRTNLYSANLSRAELISTDLSRAKLISTDLSEADLSGADFNDATIGWTIFGNVDLRTVKHLETIQHKGPSYISTSTLSRSQGDIPDRFLRGAGLDNTFIDYVRSLTSKPIEYYTCFISYSSKDELFAHRLHNDLQQEGVRCWFAPEDMDIGDKIRHRIEESIRLYDKLLLILSEHSIASNWVEYEVERALNKEPQGIPNVLYPVRVDQAVMTCSETWARDIKSTRHIGNFENWTNPQHYEENFKRLLRALNTKKKQQKK